MYHLDSYIFCPSPTAGIVRRSHAALSVIFGAMLRDLVDLNNCRTRHTGYAADVLLSARRHRTEDVICIS